MIVLGDISALTALVRIGRLELLKQFQRQVVIPEGPRMAFERTNGRLPWWIGPRQVVNHEYVGTLRRIMDDAEAQGIALYKELNADLLILDEHVARRAARREGVRLLGLMGLLMLAKNSGLIGSVRDVFTEVKLRCGFRIAPPVEAAVYARARE